MTHDIAALQSLLASDNVEDRLRAAEQLSQMGDQAAEAAPGLCIASADVDERVRDFASATLEDIGPPPVNSVAVLTSHLNTPEADIAYWAATLLGRLEAESAPAVAQLTAALSSPHLHVREQSAWALGKIGPPAAAATAALESAANGPNPRLTRLATEALALIRRS